jgi:hypothetical protein
MHPVDVVKLIHVSDFEVVFREITIWQSPAASHACIILASDFVNCNASANRDCLLNKREFTGRLLALVAP